MKKKQIAILGGAGLIAVFALAAFLYKSQQEQRIAAMAQNRAAPLVREYSQTSGSSDAKVVLVEFFDPGCETCRIFAHHVKGLLSSNPGRLQLVLRYAPFHAGSDTMVKILEAARLQGRYWETLQVMFDTQPQWASHHQPRPEKIWPYLPSAGLDLEKIRNDMESSRIQEIIQQDIADAKALGVRKTPQFFVNGRPLRSFGLAQLKALVAEEISANY